MGINLRRSSGTVPLGADAACTIVPSGTGAATNHSIFSDLQQVSAFSIQMEDEIERAAISNPRYHWLPHPCRLENKSMHDRPSDTGAPEAYAHLTAISKDFKRQPDSCRLYKLHLR